MNTSPPQSPTGGAAAALPAPATTAATPSIRTLLERATVVLVAPVLAAPAEMAEATGYNTRSKGKLGNTAIAAPNTGTGANVPIQPTPAATTTGSATRDRVINGRVGGRKSTRKPRGVVNQTQIDKHRREHPERYPDLDFHQLFGSHLTRKNPISKDVDENVAAYWKTLSTNPALLQHQIAQIIELYHTAFKQFFGIEAVSLHGHVSDTLNPYLLTSLVMHLETHQKKIPKKSKKKKIELVKEEHREVARVAVTNLYYGSGSGPQAYESVIKTLRSVACGPKPEIVDTQDPGSIDGQVRDAIDAGCTVLFTEIVRAGDGSVMSVESWKALVEACKRHCLVLAVDEAMTAIRCGAPFAYQLPEYKACGYPDLVLFGKAVRTCGIAVEPLGGNIRKLQITDDDFVKLSSAWLERYTEMAPIPDLLISAGTLLLAHKEGWPQRAQDISELLREIIESEDWCGDSTLGGLHSLIYLRQADYKETTSPVMGASAKEYFRWLPTMDEVMLSREELMAKLFGAGSLPHREETSHWFDRQGLRPRWCRMCGSNAEEAEEAEDTEDRDDRETCHKCVAKPCKDCEPEEHICPMENLDE